jgi:hypothetical protein
MHTFVYLELIFGKVRSLSMVDRTTNIHDVLKLITNLMPTMKFNMEEEKDNKIKFLDISISKVEETFPSIYTENQRN